MKLHLPLALRSSLYVLFAACTTLAPAQAAIMHSDATLITYTDFGQNVGRYKTTESANALLQHIRQQEGGVTITYTGGQQTYVMPHGMIDFGSTYHVATCAAISPSAVASCAHYYTFNSSFTNHVYGIGSTHAVQYKGIEMAAGTVGNPRWNSSVFSHTLGNGTNAAAGNGTDHKVMRLSKVITDAPYAELYDTAGKNLSNLTYYHAGSGQMWRSTYNTTTLINKSYPNNATSLTGAHAYVIGGIVSGATQYAGSTGFYSLEFFSVGGINASDPLTWVSRPGDSGSPLYVWDDASGTYQYIGSNRGEMLSGQVGSAFVTNTAFDKQVVEERYTKRVNMGTVGTVYLNAVNTQGETVTDDKGYSTTKWLGTVTGAGMETVSFVGLQSGLNTWSDLSGLKDTQNWYAYNQSYVAQKNEDLFFTENLVFKTTAKENSIVLNDTVDLGIGYAEFSGGKFTISSAEGESNLFNHAGYVINAGAEVHLQLTNPAEYMREWRKIGAGDLYIEGSGNNDVLLNLGGSGKTYLNREGGYAAYNVLVNTGATVVINDTEQIKRDLTFGNRGGTLNMNGNSMDWYTTAESEDSPRAGFSINALTEDALVANYRGSSTLTYKEAGNTTYAGSFADSADSSLKIIYDVAEGSWTLNSIRTNLQHEGSGLQVNNGTVVLRGTNTIHGSGSDTGRNSNRYSHEDDWHYADAAMNVTVNAGGTFELGSHARLTGNVTVESGGTYVMREGVRHTKEYVEGGQVLEDTGKYAAYFGHKGDVVLNGGTFAVQFNEGVDSTTAYAGNVTGTGAMTVDAGTDGGTFSFSGAVDAGVSKTLNRGQLQLSGTAAADTANKWLVNAGGVMVQFENAADTLGVIHTDSSGVIGLTGDTTTQLDLSSHSQLGIGALSGTTVQYGAAGTSETLTTLNLGGGGKLVVNYALSGSDTLNVNAGTMRGGEISLQNVAADYSGTVNVQAAGGSVSLTTGTEGALNNATVNVNDGGIYRLTDDQHALGGTVNVNAGGLLQGKDMVLTGTVTLAGAMDYNSFTVSNGGELVMGSTGAFDDKYAVTVAAGGKLNLNKTAFTQKVNLTDGGMVSGQSSHVNAGGQVLATQGTGILDAGTSMLVKGQIGAAEGATLRLTGTQVDIYTGSVNAAGGTIELACSTVNLGHWASGGTQTIGGTLTIADDVSIVAKQGDPSNYQGITYRINHLNIADGKKLTLADFWNDFWHVYQIAELSGSGEIEWSSHSEWYQRGTTRMILSGDNSFAGTLSVKQINNCGSTQHLSLAHENAAKNMVINLSGDSNSRPGLAISTATARVAGIAGTTDTFVYAGAVKNSTDGSNPVSTALNTLIINTGAENHSYAGTLLGDETKGLNIVKNGTGTQTFTNAANVVHDVTALQGHLEFTAAPTIYGDVSIAQGAQLTIGSGVAYTLSSGKTLHVLAGVGGEAATLNNSLVLDGGTIDFGAYINSETASLQLGEGCTLNTAGTINIDFSHRSTIVAGQRYRLMSGDWSGLTVNTNESLYLNSALEKTQDGLFATFSLKEGYEYWMGDTVENWAPTKDNVVITGLAPYSAEINLKADTQVQHGIFDNDEAVVIKSDTGNSLHFDSAEKIAAGDLVIDAAVSADTFDVNEDTRITGDGTFTVGTLAVNADLTTGMALNVTSINIAENAAWTLDGTEKSFTQSLTIDQVNGLSAMSVQGKATLAVAVDTETELTAAISGTGAIDKNGSGILTSTNTLEIGTLNVNSGGFTAKKSVHIGTLNVAAEQTVTMWNEAAAAGASKVLGTVALGNGSTLASWDVATAASATHINELQVKGESATLKDSHHAGYYSIGTLSSGVNKATLNLVKKSDSEISTVVNLGSENAVAGNFKGSIVLKSDTGEPGDSMRSLFLILGGQQAAAGAVVNLAESDSNTALLGLGINTENATIAGLESASGLGGRARVFSGSVGYGIKWGSGSAMLGTIGTEWRTLTINTTEQHTFHGEVLSNLNLVKQGSGTQTLAGTSSIFNGALTVQGGTLTLSGNAIGMLSTAAAVRIESGAELHLSACAADTLYQLPGNLSNEGALVFDYDISGNGAAFDFTGFGGEIRLDKGLVQLSMSVFDDEVSPTFVVKSANGQFCFNGEGTEARANLVLDATTKVHVNSGKSGTLIGDISGSGGLIKVGAGTLTLAGHNSYTGGTTVNDGTLEVNSLGDLGNTAQIDSKGTLSISEVQEATDGVVTVNGVSGSGVLAINVADDAAQTLAVNSAFTGTTYIKSGQFTTSGSTFGNGLRLGDGVNLNLTETAAATFGKNIVFDGTSELHCATDAELTITGNISTGNECTSHLVRRDSGVLNLNGTVNLNRLTQDADDITNIGKTASIGALNGAGEFNVASIGSTAAGATISNLSGYTGVVLVNKAGSGAASFSASTGGAVALEGISVLNGATADIKSTVAANKNVSLGKVSLSGGGTLGLSSLVAGDASLGSYTVTLAELNVSGSGVLKTNDGSSDEGWQAQFDINRLSGSTTDSGSLRLATASKTADKTVFNLNSAGNTLFSGHISLGVDNNGANRKAALNINDTRVAQNAIITLEAPVTPSDSAKPGSVMLGVGVDGATIRGIKDDGTSANRYIVSGALTTDSTIASDATVRTLRIATQGASDNFTSTATIKDNLNLVKSGTGTQVFTGDMSAFNGTIRVQGGTLELGSASSATKLGLGGTMVNLGTLNLNSDIRVSSADVLDMQSIAGVTNGFATGTEEVTYSVARGTGTVNLKEGGVKVYVGTADTTGTAVVQNGSAVSFTTAGGASTDTYYVFGAGATTSAIVPGDGQSLNSIYIGSEGVLSYDSATFADTVTLKGSGTYNLGSGRASAAVSGLSDAAWKGTVVLADIKGGTDAAKSTLNLTETLNALGNCGSTVKLSGANGYFNTNSTTQVLAQDKYTVLTNLVLENTGASAPAILLTNGNGDGTVGARKAIIAGNVSGSGDVKYQAWAYSYDNTVSYAFTGDVSDWTGNFIVGESNRHDGGGNANVIFSGKATTINAGVRNEDTSTATKNDLYLVIGSADEPAQAYTMNGQVSVDKLTLHQSTKFSKAVSVTGGVTLAAGKEVSLANGDMTVGGQLAAAGATISTKGRTLHLNGSGANTLGTLDAGGSTVNLASGVNLQVETNMWINTMNLAENASFSKDAIKVIGSGGNTKITANGSSQFDYTLANQKISNAEVQLSSDNAVTLGSQLENSVVKNMGAGTLKLTNAANSLSGVVAAAGDVNLQNLAVEASLDVLDVAGGKTVGLYTGADTASEKAAATVSGTAAFGAGAVLNTACLTLADGATLEMRGLEAGAVTLSGALTFGSGLQMGESLLASVGALDYGETLNLFTGLSGVNLPVAVDTESSRVLASSVFSNVQSDTLYVDYRVIDNVGTLLVANVPEPTTATLSLLALAALAARRRRKA